MHNRSNLMQVAQILKMIALMKWEEISDERLHDLYSRFDKEAMSSVLEAMLEAGDVSEGAAAAEDCWSVSDGGSSGEGGSSGAGGGGGLSRLAVLMTRRQLETVVGFFRSLRELAPPDVDLSELGALLDPLPEVIPGSTGIQ